MTAVKAVAYLVVYESEAGPLVEHKGVSKPAVYLPYGWVTVMAFVQAKVAQWVVIFSNTSLQVTSLVGDY